MIENVTTLAAIPGFDSVWAFFHKGGVFMIPLAITCLAGLMAIIYKFLSLTADRVIPAKLAREIANLDTDTSTAVIREFQEGKSTLARLGAVAMKHRGKPGAKITTAIEAAAREEIVHLHSGIGILDIVITIAPLLGLVGTASGLVVIFEGLGDTSDHAVISRGIAEALSTTIFGIAVAVPAVIAHGYFFRKIEKITARLEGLLADLTRAVERPDRP
jgi:biopolymer transport protein ExbB